ncbi:cytidylate kinase [Magnetospirillum gryphiswaldense MSR-1 v2]|uniref:Cytidylate kinase n=1 Tax=Magnetospirillum gryphiswaldense (strain DSM 6361 / JCM 21280 / NBRC 15271 / MSR-1) TaxID=431944 RepID=V6F6P6_MAGGM|nr:(d)CMP kinase [Magnetospirillum gryphiswaldense]CDL01042.1 cytidylate kinase [Magnetospirillum gryphiswaldense MSR-1 v2]
MSRVIAIDGPAAAGKGTLARRLAAELGFDYLDTGLIYRAVGMKLTRAGLDPNDPAQAEAAARALNPTELQAVDLRGDDAAQAASKVAVIPGVRSALLDFQRAFAGQPPGGKGAVLDGRDIGTVVCPGAGAKLFVTASVEKRAERRLKELQSRGVGAIHSAVLADMRERDERDSTRSAAPLKAATDAFVLDTSDLDADQAFAAALDYVKSKL